MAAPVARPSPAAASGCPHPGVACARAAIKGKPVSPLLRVEVDGRGVLRPGGGFKRDLGLGAIEYLRADRVREGADAGIIALHGFVVIAAGDQNAVLGAFKLRLKRQEILI